jgi:hypothetical protein
MENYKYTIVVNDDTGLVCGADTTNWQEAIDLFQDGKTKGYCEIVVLDNDVGALRYITDIEGIQRWSEHLMNLRYNEQQEADEEEEMFKNRILGRIAQEADGMEVVTPDFHGDFSDMEDALQEAIINPKHYKLFSKEDYSAYPNGIEYMDLCDKALAHLSGVEAHLVGQILKYTLRVGKKDAMEQDAKKIEWYATRLVNTVKGG